MLQHLPKIEANRHRHIVRVAQRVYVRVYVRACVRACVCTCVRACVRACGQGSSIKVRRLGCSGVSGEEGGTVQGMLVCLCCI